MLGTNPGDTIKTGDSLFLRRGTVIINSPKDWGDGVIELGTAKVFSTPPDLESFGKVVSSINSLIMFTNDPNTPWLGDTR